MRLLCPHDHTFVAILVYVTAKYQIGTTTIYFWLSLYQNSQIWFAILIHFREVYKVKPVLHFYLQFPKTRMFFTGPFFWTCSSKINSNICIFNIKSMQYANSYIRSHLIVSYVVIRTLCISSHRYATSCLWYGHFNINIWVALASCDLFSSFKVWFPVFWL